MNFHIFPGVQNESDTYFWSIAVPVAFVTFCFLMRDVIYRYLLKVANRRLIERSRKSRDGDARTRRRQEF